jgi:hypothetical protein
VSFKDKIMNVIPAHPKLVTFGIGLAITFVIGTGIGMVYHQQVFAFLCRDGCSQMNQGGG